MTHDEINQGAGADRWSLKVAALTHRGQVREKNEDAFSLNPRLGLYLVSDGMGGTKAGQAVADAVSRVLPLQLEELCQQGAPGDATESALLLGKAITRFNWELLSRAAVNPAMNGSGATVAACWIHKNIAVLAHLGDSRIYRMRGGRLEKLTTDHNVAALLLQMGRIDETEAMVHPGRHTLTRYVGMKPEAHPDTAILDVSPGDRMLLCSDGLWGVVEHDRLAELLMADSDLDSICERMIESANDAGGPDNITAVVIKIDPPYETRAGL